LNHLSDFQKLNCSVMVLKKSTQLSYLYMKIPCFKNSLTSHADSNPDPRSVIDEKKRLILFFFLVMLMFALYNIMVRIVILMFCRFVPVPKCLEFQQNVTFVQKSLKIPKGWSETIIRKTDNTMSKRKENRHYIPLFHSNVNPTENLWKIPRLKLHCFWKFSIGLTLEWKRNTILNSLFFLNMCRSIVGFHVVLGVLYLLF
jgi:hypothetical protein